MGDVKNSVKGSGPKYTSAAPSNSSLDARVGLLESLLSGFRKKSKDKDKDKDGLPDIPVYLGEGSLISQVKGLKEEVSRLIDIKDKDTTDEGDIARVDNVRKAEQLRSVYKLLTNAQNTLEDMY